MPDLFAPTLPEQILSAEREIRFRERVYPRLVEQGKMTQEKADRELACMRAIAQTLRADGATMRAANACFIIVDYLAKDFHADLDLMVAMLTQNGYGDIAKALSRLAPKKVISK